MTNPTNKKTHEQFAEELRAVFPSIELLERYTTTDTKIRYRCKHGEFSNLPWQLLKAKHCCRTGYYESGIMWESNKVTLEEAKSRALRDRVNIDVSSAYFIKHGASKKLAGIRCKIHNVEYSSFISQKIGLCPDCNRERNIAQLAKAAPLVWSSQSTGSFVSKKETKWLDSLNVKERQVWLEDIRYKVDGYDPQTKTVYLYHGRFWHGCPETFDPDMIHPIAKIPMKDLYERTIFYEDKIRSAGYNLIVKWGT